MNLAFIENLAGDKDGDKYLFIDRDMFDRTRDTRGKKTKGSKDFLKTILKKNLSQEIDRKKKRRSMTGDCWKVHNFFVLLRVLSYIPH